MAAPKTSARFSALHGFVARGAALAHRIAQAGSVVVADTQRVLSRRVRDVILVVLSVAFVIWAFKLLNNEHLYAELGFDEQYFVWTGWCVLKGLIPYRDFSEWKGPMVFVTHAVALALHGFRDLKFRWFFLYFPLSSLFAFYAAMLSRKIDKACALALLLLMMHLFIGRQFHDTALSDSESIGFTYYFFGVACLIARTRFGDKLKAVGVGLLVCCPFSKEPYLPSAVLTWVTCFFLDAEKENLGKQARRYFKLSLIGGGTVIALLALYLVPTGGATWYFRVLRGHTLNYKDPQHSYCAQYGRFTPTGSTASDLSVQWEQVRTDFLNLKVLGYLLPLASLFFLFVPRRSLRLFLTALLAFAGGLWATTASKCAWGHYYVMAMPALFFAMFVGIDAMTRRIASVCSQRLVGWVLCLGALVALAPRLDAEMSLHDKRPSPDAYVVAVPGVLDYLAKNTKPGDRIWTTGPPGIYVQADRVSATRESGHADAVLYTYGGNSDEERLARLKVQLEKYMPKVVILDPTYEFSRPKHMSMLVMPFLQSHGYKKDTDRLWRRPY